MDIPLDGPDHYLADGLRAGLRQEGTQYRHTCFHRVGRQQDFGNEENPVPEVDPDDPHALHESVVQHLGSTPSPFQQDAGSLVDLLGEAVVEIVVHLLDEFIVGERSEVEFFVKHFHGS